MLLQNYGWPTGPAKIWLWGPWASGKHDPWLMCLGVRYHYDYVTIAIFTK